MLNFDKFILEIFKILCYEFLKCPLLTPVILIFEAEDLIVQCDSCLNKKAACTYLILY
jgi:hypothetical protein